MRALESFDAYVVGSGPNGLSAAVRLAQVGLSVLVFEAMEFIGGGTRTEELTLPGFYHDVCSAIHPLGAASPYFRSLPLERFGLEWIYPPASAVHPLDDGRAVIVERSVEVTAAHLGRDARAYRRLMRPFVPNWKKLASEMLGPFRLPRYPVLQGWFDLLSISSAGLLARTWFRDPPARAVFGGMAAHSMLALNRPATAGFGLIVGMMAHAVGWPMARGGSRAITDALAGLLVSLGGEIRTYSPITSLAELPPNKPVLLDVTPRQALAIAGDRFPEGYRRQLERYRYGVGVFKIDYALDAPIPWRAAECARAATVHVGGTLEEIEASERDTWSSYPNERPFVLLAQQSLFDESRAPHGKHTAWAYCHVPNQSTVDMTGPIEAQIERFAPGFRSRILARSTLNPAQMEQHNPNYIGGDINGGVQDLAQFFTRPVARWVPYNTPDPMLYFCSSSTPPGGGVHGMSGYHAAQAVLRRIKNNDGLPQRKPQVGETRRNLQHELSDKAVARKD